VSSDFGGSIAARGNVSPKRLAVIGVRAWPNMIACFKAGSKPSPI